jgi:adenosylmethionine-8-amino-7-oxononanoate aminotransferase
MHPLARLDHQYLWHPFTQMRDWLRHEPIVIQRGQGAVLTDVYGRNYLDANSSIWTNLHGHNHPKINRAISAQLKKIAHSSALGFANEPASLLAEKLVRSANPPWLPRRPPGSGSTPERLAKVFFSDDGSTAMEVALKLAYESARRAGNRMPRFLSLDRAYHGDTTGAVSLGHIDLFHKAFAGLLFKTDTAFTPYCYRCPFNRTKPQRADARDYRQCQWECLDKLESKFVRQAKKNNSYAGFVFEPLIQGAAGMIAQPQGWLTKATTMARAYGVRLVADEVMTGFGRTGSFGTEAAPGLFACHREHVQPDFLALAKGLTGGYLPMAATLTTQAVFDSFLGDYAEFKTFFHGHSFTGNQLGAAAGLSSMALLHEAKTVRARAHLESQLRTELQQLWALPNVGDIRQVGLVAGIELVKDWRTREAFDLKAQAGIKVCDAMARMGVLTRPIGNVIALLPPYCTTADQLSTMVHALGKAVAVVFRTPISNRWTSS